MSYVMNFSKENFKFSSSHFTMFNATDAERLHGHNYGVSLSLRMDELSDDIGMAVDFNEIKSIIKKNCDYLDEYILIPKNSPFLKIQDSGEQTDIQFANKKYSLPNSDLRILNMKNVTCEELARFMAESVAKDLKTLMAQANVKFTDMSLSVRETLGQSVSYEMKL